MGRGQNHPADNYSSTVAELVLFRINVKREVQEGTGRLSDF